MSDLLKFKFFIFLTTKNKNKIISGKSSKFIPPISNPKFGGMRRESAKILPMFFELIFTIFINLFKWARQDSNLRPTDYESVALTN